MRSFASSRSYARMELLQSVVSLAQVRTFAWLPLDGNGFRELHHDLWVIMLVFLRRLFFRGGVAPGFAGVPSDRGSTSPKLTITG